MKFNPFQPNRIVAPGMFTGRGEEIVSIGRSLFQAKNGNPQHFLIEGERGIGKSSLLFLVSNVACGEFPLPNDQQRVNFLIVSIDAGGITTQTEIIRSIARELKSSIGQMAALKESAKRVWDFLSNWEVLGVRYHKETEREPDPDELRDTLVAQVADILSAENSPIDGIFIVIDEADAPPVEAGLGEFLKSFTERLTRRNCNNVLIGLAGLPTLLAKLRASHESSPRLFTILNLRPLEHDERIEIVERGLAQANTLNDVQTSIEPEALDLLAELSEGYPHFVQQFSYCAFDRDEDNHIDAEDVLEGAYEENGAIFQLGSKYFDEMYYSKISSEEYRKVLDAMAEHGDAWIPRQQIVEESGIKATTVANAFKALSERQIIISDPTRRGFYRLPTRSFAAWINAVKSIEEKKGGDLLDFTHGGDGGSDLSF